VKDDQLVDITYDNGPVELDDPAAAADLPIPKRRGQSDDRVITAERERLLKYCVIGSLILHFLVFVVVPRMSAFQQTNSALKPAEQNTPVRLVQFQEPPKKEEPPPEKPAAISDRNHTAEKERLPKNIPTPKTAPIGKIEQPRQQIASLQPPPAPEDIEKERQEPKPEAKKSQPDPSKADKKKQEKAPVPVTKPLNKKNIKNMNVDLQPTVQEMKTAFNSPSPGSPDFYPDGEVEEAIVDMNSREDRFYSYLMGLKRKIEAVWVYPQHAARSGIGGTLMLEFVIAKDGKLEALNLLDSSGHSILDQSALAAIKTAAPYNPFPPSVRAKRLRIRANFIYVTSDFFKRVLR
jgi:periplasmic protein TonB